MAKGKGRSSVPGRSVPGALSASAARLQQAIALHQQGQLWQAEALYRETLKAQPRNFDALHLLGVIEAQRGNYPAAVELIGRAIKVDPSSAAAHANLGNALLNLGRAKEALASYNRALAFKPDYPEALNNRGNALRQLGQPLEALASYDKALALKPDYANALLNRGNALADLKRHGESLECYERALALAPESADVLLNRGNALRELGRSEEALASYDRALAARPAFADALYNRGNALMDLKRHEEALASYDSSLSLVPDHADALVNRGNALTELKHYDAALESYDRALGRIPLSVEALYNRGNALRGLGRDEEALSSYERALALAPGYAEALYNRGNTLRDLDRHEDAAKSYSQVIEAAPEYDYALGAMIHSRLHCCDWTDYAGLVRQVTTAVREDRRASSPFAFLSFAESAADQLRCARTCAADRYPAVAPTQWTGAHNRHDRIRVAYVSADFGETPVSYLMAGLFEKHDPARFEPIAVSLRPVADAGMGQRVKSAFGRFLDVSRESDSGIAAMLRGLEVDIAVDLMGYTGANRTGIFARRCAPVQVNYLGFPATMGADYIDYIIADAFVVPDEYRECYAEHVVLMPDCFQVNDDKRKIAQRRPSRAEAGLPEAGLVFCSFNNSYKINPAVFDVWMRLLKQTPDSVLWVVAGNARVEANLCAAAAGRGVEPGRLIFAQRLTYADHLARVGLADLFLDTMPFNAGTTASDALWAGVPVLTCSGEAFASRMAGSLLRAAGLPELVTSSLEDYEKRALDLAAAPDALAELREKLARNRNICPLFDTDRFRQHLESAYATMWERHQRGESPQSFAVQPVA